MTEDDENLIDEILIALDMVGFNESEILRFVHLAYNLPGLAQRFNELR